MVGNCFRFLRKCLGRYNVESIIILVSFTYFLTDGLVKQQIVYYVQKESSKQDETQSTSNVTADDAYSSLQDDLYADRLLLLNQLVAVLPGAILSLMLAPAADQRGRRRIFILLPLIGRFATLLALTFVLPSALSVALSAMGEGLWGGTCLLTVGLYSLLRDTTSDNRIAARVAITLGLATVSGLMGAMVSGKLLDDYGVGPVYMMSMAITLASALLALVAVVDSGDAPTLEDTEESVCTMLVPFRTYQKLLFDDQRQVALYLLASFAFHLGQMGQAHITVYYNGLDLYFFGTVLPFSVTMEKLVSLLGYLLVVPLTSGVIGVVLDDDLMGMAGNVSMVILCIAKAMLTDHPPVWGAFGVSFFMLIGCLSNVAALSSIINSVTSLEIGAAMAAQSVLKMMAKLIAEPATDAIFLNTSSRGFTGSVLLFAAAAHFLAFTLYGVINRRARRRRRPMMTTTSGRERLSDIDQSPQQQFVYAGLSAAIGVF